MKKCICGISLVVLLVLGSLGCIGYASAEPASTPHQYLSIPFAEATPEMVTKILLDQKGIAFETSSKTWSGKAHELDDFGYLFDLQFDFNEDYMGTNRILLSSAQPARVPSNEFQDRLQSDLLQFLDMEAQLTALYGEPDWRFFHTNSANDDKKDTRYMFQAGVWELATMMEVCEKNLFFQSFSIWDNVVLQTWVDWAKSNTSGEYLSRVMLTYYPDLSFTAPMIDAPISAFPLLP